MGTMIRHTVKCIAAIALILHLAACDRGKEQFWPQSFEELEGHNVALLEGSAQQDYCTKWYKDSGINFQIYPSRADAMTAVVQGKADVAILNAAETFNDSFNRMNLKVCHSIGELKFDIGFAVKKGNTALLEQTSQFIDSLKNDGTLDEMTGRWMNPDNLNLRQNVVLPLLPALPENPENVLIVGVADVKSPYELMIDNKWTGYEIEILQRFAAARGYNLQLEIFQFNSLIPALETGKIDIICSSFFINEERMRRVDFTTPHCSTLAAFCVHVNSSAKQGGIWSRIKESAYYSLVVDSRWELIVQGFAATVKIAFLALILGSIFGALICWMHMSRSRFLSRFARIYVTLMRNLPMLVLLLIMFYVVLAHSGLSAPAVSIIAFAMSSGAFFCEIFRTGIQSVSHGQMEAGLALGMSPFRTFCLVVAPQAAVRSLPVYKNECISLLKGTAVVGYISVIDMTKASDLIRSSSLEAFFPLMVISVLYFLIAWFISVLLDKLIDRLIV